MCVSVREFFLSFCSIFFLHASFLSLLDLHFCIPSSSGQIRPSNALLERISGQRPSPLSPHLTRKKRTWIKSTQHTTQYTSDECGKKRLSAQSRPGKREHENDNLTMDEHQLDQLGASLAAIVASLRGHLHDSDGDNVNINDGYVQDTALATTLSGVVEGLTSIRTSIGDIARILAEHRKESPLAPRHGNGNEKREKSVELTSEDFPTGFRSQLDVCVTGCRAVLERLDGVAAALGSNSPKKIEVYDDSDWESVAESAGGSQLLGRDHEEVLSRVEAVIGPLGGAVGILIGVLTARASADKQALLDCSTTRDNFRQLERCLAELSAKNESRGPRWGTLLKPLRLLGGKAANNSTGRLQSKPSKTSLPRAKTWPTLFKGVTDSEEEEARRRSAMIDKQIEEQSVASRNTCTVVIAWGRHAPNILLTDTFARLSTDGAVGRGRDLPGVAEALNLPSIIGCIRRQIQWEARKMVSAYVTETMGQEEAELTNRLTELLDGNGEGIVSGEAQELMRQWDSRRSREPPGTMDAWGECRLPEFDGVSVSYLLQSDLARRDADDVRTGS